MNSLNSFEFEKFWFRRSCVTFLFTLLFLFQNITVVNCERKPMKFKTPQLNDEETHSIFLPDNLKCDACHAISYQMHKMLSEFNDGHKYYKYNLPESELIELFENICSADTYQGYGVKTVNGENRLYGKGIYESDNVAGVIAGGGKWPGRLKGICTEYIEHLGELDMYEAYKQDPKNHDTFHKYLCLGDNKARSACSKTKKKNNDEL